MIRRIQIFLPFFFIFQTLHAWQFFMHLLSFADDFKINFFEKVFQEHYGLDPDQVPHSVPLDLGPNSPHLGYQQTRKVAASKERVIETSPLYLKLYM